MVLEALGGALLGGDIGGGAGGALGSLAVMLGAAGDGGEDERQEMVNLWRALQTPNFNFSEIPPPVLRAVAEKYPQLYNAAIQSEVALPEDSPELRGRLEGNLDYLEGVRDKGLPLAEKLRAQELQRAMASEHSRAVQGSLRDLAARGRLGGGRESALRMGASQQSSEMANAMGSALAREAVMNRYRAAQDLGAQAGALRAQDIGLSQARSSALNRFNEFASGLHTQAARDAAMARERAQDYNVGTAQRVADQNQAARYNARLANLNRGNALLQQDFGNRVAQTGGLTGALGNQAHGLDAEQAANANNIMNIGRGVGQAAGSVFGLF